MPQHMKIATCCYCGTRATLILNKARHELACGSCGAPLHQMKMMPQRADKPVKSRPQKHAYSSRKPEKKISRKPRKSFRKKLFEELWDVVEDIFD